MIGNTMAILARDADTGEMVWALQTSPHDLWDYDAVNEKHPRRSANQGKAEKGARAFRRGATVERTGH